MHIKLQVGNVKGRDGVVT